MKLSYYIFALYIIVYPFYFFERGNPQVSDIFGVLLIAINLKSILLNITASPFTKSLFLFVVYTIVINTIWMLLLGDILILKSSAYYLYSFFMLLLFYSKIKDQAFLSIIIKAIAISLVIQLLLWPFVTGQGVRIRMFFKDPNQLAFWSFSMLIISHLVCSILRPKRFYIFTTLILATFFVFISASKSAIYGSLIFWAYYLVKSRKQLFALLALVVIGTSFLIALDKINLSDVTTINNVIDRVTEKKKAGKGGLEGRGYDRILNHPEYLLFGAGEGQYKRFNERIELHSTFFNILFSYGIIGFTLFLIAIISILRNANMHVILLLIILVLYTLAHMTLRSPLFWITLLLLYHLKLNSSSSNKLQSSYE